MRLTERSRARPTAVARRLLGAALGLALLAVAPEARAQEGQFTEWGWPQPYEQVSRKSIDWLEQPFVDYIAVEGDRVARRLHQGGRVKTEVTAADFERYLIPSFMVATYKKLGWKVPKQPPYFPSGSDTLAAWVKAETPYRQILPYRLQAPQPFPEPGDLEKPWYFAGRWYRPTP